MTTRNRLYERLLTRGWEFDFFQAVWLLERSTDEQVAVGERGPVGAESFRFRPDVSMGFPATDVRRITRRTDPAGDLSYFEVEVTFLGLYGVSTPLPLHYAVDILRSVEQAGAPTTEADAGAPTSDALTEVGKGSSPARDFLDLFHHRLISLFYRTWLKYRYDRSFGLPGRDMITSYLLWLIGCSSDYDEAVLGIPPLRLLRYAGTLTQRPRSAVTLESVLVDYWKGLPFRARQCVGRWVLVSPADRNRIGVANSTLGVDLTVGEQVYDLAGAFDLSVGPVDWETYLLFLPDGRCFAETCALVRHYCVDPLWFGIELRLRAGEVPELRLSSDDSAARLGYTSWVRTDDMAETSVTFDASTRARSGGPVEAPEPSAGARAA